MRWWRPSRRACCNRSMSRHGARSSGLRAALAALGFALCSPLLPAADQLVDFDRHIDFAKFRTFAIRGANVEMNRPEIRNSLVTDRTSAQVRTALAAHGLRECTGGLLWRGTRRNRERTPSALSRQLSEDARKLIGKYPPGGR